VIADEHNFALELGGSQRRVTDEVSGSPIYGALIRPLLQQRIELRRGRDGHECNYLFGGRIGWHLLARTVNTTGHLDELYDNYPCPGGACTITSGTQIPVVAGGSVSNINFALARFTTSRFRSRACPWTVTSSPMPHQLPGDCVETMVHGTVVTHDRDAGRRFDAGRLDGLWLGHAMSAPSRWTRRSP